MFEWISWTLKLEKATIVSPPGVMEPSPTSWDAPRGFYETTNFEPRHLRNAEVDIKKGRNENINNKQWDTEQTERVSFVDMKVQGGRQVIKIWTLKWQYETLWGQVRESCCILSALHLPCAHMGVWTGNPSVVEPGRWPPQFQLIFNRIALLWLKHSTFLRQEGAIWLLGLTASGVERL